MELKEYIRLIKKHRILFWSIWTIFLLVGIGLVVFQPKTHTVSFSIDISRKGSVDKNNIQKDFDQYYRLEADERFSRQVVAWLSDPATLNEIKKESPKSNLKKIKAEKLGPSFVSAKYKITNLENAHRTQKAIEEILNKKVDRLDPNNKEWFLLIFSPPVVSKNTLPFLPVMIGVVAGGMLFSVFGVLVRHYWE